jgi:DNA-binding transcriptional MerR regulator
MSTTLTRREPARKYAERRGVTVKTLDRWVKAGILQPPERIKNRKYFNPDAEPRRDDDSDSAA